MCGEWCGVVSGWVVCVVVCGGVCGGGGVWWWWCGVVCVCACVWEKGGVRGGEGWGGRGGGGEKGEGKGDLSTNTWGDREGGVFEKSVF